MVETSIVTGLQIRAARTALRWSVTRLAEVSKVSTSTIKRVEAEDSVSGSTTANIAALKAAIEAAGIEFIGTPDDRPGIRIGPAKPEAPNL